MAELRTSIALSDLGGSATQDIAEAVRFVVEAERLGVGTVWSAEAWGTDGVVPLAYVAALTSRIRLATGILQITAVPRR